MPGSMMTRLDKGEVYHFISFAKMKLCTTHDWHFFSDDEKWKMGNYFTDLTIAKNCEEEVRDYAEPIMEKFNTNSNRNIRSSLLPAAPSSRTCRKARLMSGLWLVYVPLGIFTRQKMRSSTRCTRK